MTIYDDLPTTRRCGSCDLCCTAVRVVALAKGPSVRCPHLAGEAGKSCSIYAQRPKECEDFICLWRCSDTLIPQHLYPRDAGFVLSLGGRFGTFPTVIAVNPDPDRPGAWDTPECHALFFELAAKFNAIVVVGEAPIDRLIFSPKGNIFSRLLHPHLFSRKDGFVGLPAEEFLPFQLSKPEIARLLFCGGPGDKHLPYERTP